jgi:hypothetical protein
MAYVQFRHLRIGGAVVCLAAGMNAGCTRLEPGELQVTPAGMTLARGETRVVRVVDAEGNPPANVFWQSGNTAIAEVLQENGEMVIRARAPGNTCIDAIVLPDIAKTCVTVLDTPEVPAGHLRWFVRRSATYPTAGIEEVIPARHAGENGAWRAPFSVNSLGIDHRMPLPPTPALFVVEVDRGIGRNDGGSLVIVRGLDAEGRERWRHYVDNVLFQTGVADPQGGIVLVFRQATDITADTTDIVLRLDSQGVESWTYDAPGAIETKSLSIGGNTGPYGIRPDGTVLLVESRTVPTTTQVATLELIGLDGVTGKVTSRLPLPLSRQIYEGKDWNLEPLLSPMVIDEDGTAALAIATTTEDAATARVTAALKLLRLSPNGTAAWQTIQEREDAPRVFSGYSPVALMSNGQGALQVVWSPRIASTWSYALATKTKVTTWESSFMLHAIDGRGHGYSVTPQRDVVRLDVTTGATIGAAIRIGDNVGVRMLSGLPGGVIVRDDKGRLHEYDSEGTLLRTLPMPSHGRDPWRPMLLGDHLVETEGANVWVYRIDNDQPSSRP